MTQKDKELLLKDLCARLPYGLKVNVKGVVYGDRRCRLTGIHHELDTYIEVPDGMQYHIESIKPYLFPLSSMTEEQKHELKMSTCPNGTGYFNEYSLCCPVNRFGEDIPFNFMSSIIEYLNENHFDYRGLIDKGLAIDATGLNIY